MRISRQTPPSQQMCSLSHPLPHQASAHPVVSGGAAGKGASPSAAAGSVSWESAGGMDQITVVRIDDTHIAGEQLHGGKGRDEGAEYYEVEYSLPGEEEEEDGVYVIEYSNPEEEGESYQFTMSVDRSLPDEAPPKRPAAAAELARTSLPATARPGRRLPPKERPHGRPAPDDRTPDPEADPEADPEEAAAASVLSNKSVLEVGEGYSDVMRRNAGTGKQLVCSLCPPPRRLFKRASGLAIHLKQIHFLEGKKTFFCTSCQQSVRTQIELDGHTRRHAHQDAVFTCHLCPAHDQPEEAGFRGSRLGLKKHLEAEHPGVVPRCDICNKSFKSLASYLSDQFRHVGVSPYYCARCQIYEMTERGLRIHTKNHDRKKKPAPAGSPALAHAVSTSVDNSATDDSDF